MLQKTSQIKKKLPGPMQKAVSRSLRAKNFEEQETWGQELALAYAKQLDDANKVRREVLAILDEADTASKTWHQKLVQVEKYIVAETTLANIGPKLLALMKELGCTPVLVKATTPKGGKSDADEAVDPVEDELAALRAQRRGAASGTA